MERKYYWELEYKILVKNQDYMFFSSNISISEFTESQKGTKIHCNVSLLSSDGSGVFCPGPCLLFTLCDSDFGF